MEGDRALPGSLSSSGEKQRSPCAYPLVEGVMFGCVPSSPPLFLCKYLRCISSPSLRPSGSLGEPHSSTGSNGDIAAPLAQMVVICMQMRNKLNLVSLLTSCPIKEGSQSSEKKKRKKKKKSCHHTTNLSPQINYNEDISHHLFLAQREISCFSSTSC